MIKKQLTPVFVFGAGGHAKVVIDAIERGHEFRVVGVFDDDPTAKGRKVLGHRVLGGREELQRRWKQGLSTSGIVAIGGNGARRIVSQWLTTQGCKPVTVVHPRATVAPSCELGTGVFIAAQAVINADAVVDDGVIVNSGAIVEHDCTIGAFTHVAPNSVLCGEVSVGEAVLVGAGSKIIPQKTVGDGAVIGAGATVVGHVPAQQTVVGTPAAARASAKPACAASATHSAPAWSPWPYYADDEVEAVSRVLRSGKVNYWTGQECREFEKEYAAAADCRYAIGLTNGTVALEAALFALGIGPGDEVITTPRTFIASASCAVMRGARPVLADIDPNSQNITAETIERVITPRTKAIIAVHLAGWPCDMEPICELARRHGIKVIEDCAQAHGAMYRGRPIGAFGDMAAFSFCQDKIISTGGEGGMLTTNDEALWSTAWSFKDHGKSFDAVYRRQHPPGFRWLHESFGTNWRMTEVQAVLGRSQLRKLPEWVETRRAHAALLTSILGDSPCIRVPAPPDDVYHAYYRYYAFVRPETLAADWSRDRIFHEATARGIPCFTGSCGEIYLEKAFPADWRPSERLPVAKELGETSLCLLVHPTLTAEEVRRHGQGLRAILDEATTPALRGGERHAKAA